MKTDSQTPIRKPVKGALESLYRRYNSREFIHPDPLIFLHDYEEPREREVVGLIASSLAYGNVRQIHSSISSILKRMPRPARFLDRATRSSLRRKFADFKHRWTTGEDLVAMLFGAKRVIARRGSLQACFTSGLRDTDETVLPALAAFVSEMRSEGGGGPIDLLPCPTKGSACKRLNLFLRWMVRQDDVDPGGWDQVPTSKLIVPLDTHMHRIGLALNLTRRKQANLRTALELTRAFRTIAPDDPVRYDFALTRLGIRRDGDPGWLTRQCAESKVI